MNNDTHAHSTSLAAEQIAKEDKVHAELDVLENRIFGLWDEFYEIPYRNKLSIRIREELPSNVEASLHELINAGKKSDYADAALEEVMSKMTLGLFFEERLFAKTDLAFWKNPENWNVRRVESIIMSYLSRMQEVREELYSFPRKEAQQSENDSRGNAAIK